jgi:uncharacterized protein (DUF1330 family)
VPAKSRSASSGLRGIQVAKNPVFRAHRQVRIVGRRDCFRVADHTATTHFSQETALAAHEAGWVELTVIVEFESVERAKAAYETDAYRRALASMMHGVERDLRILEGMCQPDSCYLVDVDFDSFADRNRDGFQ